MPVRLLRPFYYLLMTACFNTNPALTDANFMKHLTRPCIERLL